MGRRKHYVDLDYLKRIGVEQFACVVSAVIDTINEGVFNPGRISAALLQELGMVTCRTFETPAAGTIPLFLLERNYVTEIFGERAIELVLDGEHAHEKIVDVLERPGHYADIVMGIREDFGRRHTPERRLRELVSRSRRSPWEFGGIRDSEQADFHFRQCGSPADATALWFQTKIDGWVGSQWASTRNEIDIGGCLLMGHESRRALRVR